MLNLKTSILELPPSAGSVMNLYSVYSSFESCPNVVDILTKALELYNNRDMAYIVTKMWSDHNNWSLAEIDASRELLIQLQQDIAVRLQSYGIICPESVSLYRHHQYSIIMVVKEYV